MCASFLEEYTMSNTETNFQRPGRFIRPQDLDD